MQSFRLCTCNTRGHSVHPGVGLSVQKTHCRGQGGALKTVGCTEAPFTEPAVQQQELESSSKPRSRERFPSFPLEGGRVGQDVEENGQCALDFAAAAGRDRVRSQD